MSKTSRRLRILTWHVHGNYLYYLSHVPHDFYLVTKPGYPAGYAGTGGALPFGANVHELPAGSVREASFDCVLYQHRRHYDHDRVEILTEAQRALPRIYLEHDPPLENPYEQPHWAQDAGLVLVHVTFHNQLMWDNGITPARVIEHGVVVPEDARYTGELARGIVIVNHLVSRGRRLGADVVAALRDDVPLEIIGMEAEAAGGRGEVPNLDVPYFAARHRFLFSPIRWTSLGLAIVEAMTVGLPVVGLATSELASVIRSGHDGFLHNDLPTLREVMRELLADQGLARTWGQAARRTALERYGIERFVADWSRLFAEVTSS
jgi:hypothetical protein